MCVGIRRQFAAPNPESHRDMCEQHVQCGGPGQPCCDDGCSFGTTCTDKGCERCGGYNQLCCGHPKGDLGLDGLTVRELCPFAGMHLSCRDAQVAAWCRTGDWWCCPSRGNHLELQLWSRNHLDLSHSELNHLVTLHGVESLCFMFTSVSWKASCEFSV
jgi:hypothetical protein